MFNDADDLTLVRIIHEEQVWAAPHGKKTDRWASVWRKFVDQLPANAPAPMQRSCQDRYNMMYEKALQLRNTASARSGAHDEKFEEIDELLLECIEQTLQHTRKLEDVKEKDAAKQAQINATQTRLRNHSIQQLSKRSRISPSSASSSRSSSSSVSSPSSSCSSPSSAPPSSSFSSSRPPPIVIADDADEMVDETSSYKRSRPSMKLQRESINTQKEQVSATKTVGDAIVQEAKRHTDVIKASMDYVKDELRRSNDLLEQYLRRRWI